MHLHMSVYIKTHPQIYIYVYMYINIIYTCIYIRIYTYMHLKIYVLICKEVFLKQAIDKTSNKLVIFFLINLPNEPWS